MSNGSMVHVTREVKLMYDGDLIAFEIIHIKEARENLRKHNIKERLDILLPKFGFKRVSLAQAEFLAIEKALSIATVKHKLWFTINSSGKPVSLTFVEKMFYIKNN